MSAVLVAFLAIACAGDIGVEEGEWLPGGETTNTFLFGSNALTAPAANITFEHDLMFATGNSFFNLSWVEAPSSTESRDGVGPTFNARSCSACHFKDGRGSPPLDADEPFVGVLLRLSVPGQQASGAPSPDPRYGGQLQPLAIPGVPAEGRPVVTYEEVAGAYADGETYTLLRPTYAITDLAYGPLDANIEISPRVAPAMVGLGLLQAIPVARLEELADPEDADGDGVSGRINRVVLVGSSTPAVGRFGWKAEQPTVRQQSAGAFVGDIGITSSEFPDEGCPEVQLECSAAERGGAPEISDSLMDRVEAYGMLVAVPARQRYDDDRVLRGKALFQQARCDGCHVPRHQTGALESFPELSGQTIWPYTDLLLHDMGPELGDGRPSFLAGGDEWRTPPLWALRFYPIVNGHDRLLHDGRARGVAEAILWHGGEAEASREAFRAMSADDRDALVEFVESL